MKQSYPNYIKGKSVALIAGKDVDETEANKYDVVVRVNNHWVRSGGRMDVLYLNSAHDTKNILATSPSLDWLLYDVHGTDPHEARRWAEHINANVQPYVKDCNDPNYFYCKAFRACMNFGRSSPFMGTTAAYHLAELEPSDLYITGMDFYTSIPKAEWKIGVCSHNPRCNAMAISLLWEKYNNLIIMDEMVEEALEKCEKMSKDDPLKMWEGRSPKDSIH